MRGRKYFHEQGLSQTSDNAFQRDTRHASLSHTIHSRSHAQTHSHTLTCARAVLFPIRAHPPFRFPCRPPPYQRLCAPVHENLTSSCGLTSTCCARPAAGRQLTVIVMWSPAAANRSSVAVRHATRTAAMPRGKRDGDDMATALSPLQGSRRPVGCLCDCKIIIQPQASGQEYHIRILVCTVLE